MNFTEEMLAEDEKRWHARDVVTELGYCGKYMRDRKDMTNLDIRFYAYIMRKAHDMLKAQEPRVMSLDLPEAEWHDKVIWLEIKGKKPTPCLFRECSDRMMFGHYERLMYFDVVGSCQESGYMLKNYGVKWRCWTSRPTDAQMEAEKWES